MARRPFKVQMPKCWLLILFRSMARLSTKASPKPRASSKPSSSPKPNLSPSQPLSLPLPPQQFGRRTKVMIASTLIERTNTLLYFPKPLPLWPGSDNVDPCMDMAVFCISYTLLLKHITLFFIQQDRLVTAASSGSTPGGATRACSVTSPYPTARL